MAISKTTIATILNARLKRSETSTSIAAEITAALRHLSRLADWPACHTTTQQVLTAGTENNAVPTNFRKVDVVTISDGTLRGEPIEEVDYNTYRQLRADETSASRAEPVRFALRGGYFYWHPVPGAAATYTAYIDHWRLHPDQDTILFGDEFCEAIYAMTMLRYLQGKGLWVDPKTQAISFAAYKEVAGVRLEQDKAQLLTAQQILQDELFRMLGGADMKAPVGTYRDI